MSLRLLKITRLRRNILFLLFVFAFCTQQSFSRCYSCYKYLNIIEKVDSSEKYAEMPADGKVTIRTSVVSKIDSVIQELDAGFWRAGRVAALAADPELAIHVIEQAQVNAGYANGYSFFKGIFFDDMIHVHVSTSYNENTLKLVEFSPTLPHNGVHGAFIYNADIKITYTVQVGNKTKTGFYTQEKSQITTLIKLQ